MREYFLFVFFIAQLAFCSCNGQNKKKIWKETIGVSDLKGGYNYSTIHYAVNGIEHSGRWWGAGYRTIVEGEKYTMRYNEVDPNEIEIDYWHPVFEKGEQTSFFVGRITRVYNKNIFTVPAINYIFVVDSSVEIKQLVLLPDNYKQLYPNLKVGQLYEVECWDSNVYRSVIYLNRPVRDTI